MLKKILAMILSMLAVLSLCACAAKQENPVTNASGNKTPTTEPTTEKPAEEPTMDWTKKDSLKILVLGHSLMVDSGHMLALIAATEGMEDLTVGTLYYSGCPLYRHVEFLSKDEPAYSLYMSSTKTPNQPPEVMDNVTMGQALRYQDWDIIIMQGGTFELAKEETFTNGHIQTIQNYVNDNKLKQEAIFAWHMPWAFATERELQEKYTAGGNPYISGYEAYNNDRVALYKAFAANVEKYIITDDTFKFLVPSGTAIENAMSSYLTEFDLLRDYAHASDLGRVIASYTWYCKLAGVEELTELKFTTIPKNFFRSTQGTMDRELTEIEQKIIIESVNNALKNPLQVTQSQYTAAPTE